MKKLSLILSLVFLLLIIPEIAMTEIRGIEKLEELQPKFRSDINWMLGILHHRFPNDIIAIVCAYRSPEEQDRILKEKGNKATLLKGGQSKHQHGLAVDIYFMEPWDFHKKFKIAPYDFRYKEMGEIAEQIGLIWGGRWLTPFDPGHIESKEKIK